MPFFGLHLGRTHVVRVWRTRMLVIRFVGGFGLQQFSSVSQIDCFTPIESDQDVQKPVQGFGRSGEWRGFAGRRRRIFR